jgi:hypothetical protein
MVLSSEEAIVGGEGCLLLLIIVGVVVLFIRSVNIRRDLEMHVENLKREIAELRAAVAAPRRESAADRVEAMKRPVAPVPRAVEAPPPPVIPPASAVPPPSPRPEGPEVEPPPITLAPSGLPEGSYPPSAPSYAAAAPEPAAPSGPSLLDRWEQFKANVDWELFTGVKLFAGLGGLALFIGAGFFVKYSIDRNLIPPALRLAVSALIGLALIIWSSRINRERFSVLRHTLGAGGIGVLYSVVFAATLYYHYLSNPVGFGLLIIVSATAFVLAVFFRGIPISVLGALGAYLTPLLVSTGQGSLVGLFVYLSVVNVGLFQVVTRLRSGLLLFIATVGTLGTLFLAAFSGRIHPESIVIAGVFIANLALFSYFLDRGKESTEGTRFLSWSGFTLYLSATLAALLLLDRDGIGPLLIAIFGMAGGVVLAFRDKRWFNGVVPYGAIMFVVAFLWTWLRFDPRTLSWGFLGLLMYGTAGGLGPVLLIRRYGLDKVNLGWFRVFPVALGVMLLAVVLKEQDIAFWFWPVILLLQVMGIMVSLVFGALLQAALLVLFFLACGLTWLFRVPPELGSPVFFGFLLFAGAALALAMVYAFKKMNDWRAALTKDAPDVAAWTAGPMVTEWLSAFPASAVFILLAASFWLQRPLQPNPGMVMLACFLSLSIFLSRRLEAPIMGMVVLLSSLVSQAAWAFRPDLSVDLHVVGFLWSAAFFVVAVIAPFLFFRSIEKWSRLWMAWALFEVAQGLFAIWAADHIWVRETSGWLPLALAVVKLPAVALLQSRLKDRPERNAVLAFHGGVLLFYISSVPVMLLDQGWIGLTLVIESTLLLWLNRRVVHEGLRWVASFMAPIGLLLLFFALPQMKHAGDMAILNAAVLAVAGAVAALAFAVPLSAFPDRKFKDIDLSEYFRWLAVGSGFFLLNLAIADIFAETELFRLAPGPDAVQAICYALVWLTYGGLIWSRLKITSVMRHAGLILLCIGTGFLLVLPVLFPAFVPAMSPFLNLGLPAYLYALVVLALLVRRELKQQTSRELYNLLVLLLLLTGFVAVKVQMSSIVQPGQPFRLFLNQSSSMAVGSAAGWLAYGLGLLYWPRGLDRPFRIAGVVLVLAGLAKALTYPFAHSAAFGAMMPLVNTPSVMYLAIVIVLTALTLNRPQQHWPFVSPTLRAFWGVLLAVVTFCVLNIEISSVFTETGGRFSLETYGNLAHQLAYSLSWLLYSIGLLIVGIKWNTSKVRWAALILMVGTTFKIFFMDLWRLGQLYRVASFIGLAAVLILVSFLYQRFMTGKDVVD